MESFFPLTFRSKIATWTARMCLAHPRPMLCLSWWPSKERSKYSGTAKIWEVLFQILQGLNIFDVYFWSGQIEKC